MMLPMLAYVTASLSFLTIFAYISLLLVFLGLKLHKYRAKVTAKSAVIFLVLAVAAGVGAVAYFQGNERFFAGKTPDKFSRQISKPGRGKDAHQCAGAA
jgi:uncharacterized membrane protein YqjE